MVKLKKSIKILILLLSVLLCLTMTSCLSLISTIEMVYNNALDTSQIDDREISYDIDTPLAVTFLDGDMCVVWDTEEGYTYSVIVNKASEVKTYDSKNEFYSEGKLNLTKLGYNFSDDLSISLNKAERLLFGTSNTQIGYAYKGINAETYDKYTKKVAAGFSEIDYYIATREEWFDFWSYLIIFRENYTYNQGCYEVESDVYMAYDYVDLYSDGTSAKDAFAYEVYSAIDAYEDSAAYSYSFEMADDNVTGSVYLKFFYDTTPLYTSKTALSYKNGVDNVDKAHYKVNETEAERNFPIDKITKTISVSSSDQLYFAIKKGYRPEPVAGSNAEYLYNRMKEILSIIIVDTDSDANKAHYIYDYIINTVIYDYDFTENIYKSTTVSTYQLFCYRCLYMEGVFGLTSQKTFKEENCIAICDGLSKAYLCMVKIEGIDCLKISGTVREESHAWNKVKIDDKWYMVDTTWGNRLQESTKIEYLSHDYILVPDDENHVESKYYNYPKATKRYYFGEDVDNDPTDDNNNSGGASIFPFRPTRPHIAA